MARGTIITKKLEDGTKRYVTVIRLNGKQKWKTFTKKKEAEGYLDRNSTDVREGTWRELKKATFAKYVTAWRAKNLIPEKVKPATMNSYGSNIAKHLIPEFGPRQITAIDADNITRFESQLLRSGQAPKSTRNILNVLHRILGDAQTDGYLRVSPMINVKLSKLEHKEGRALTPDEAQALLTECKTTSLHLIVLIGLLAGLRRTELFALRWEDIDFDDDVIRIRRNLFWRYGQYQDRPDDEPVFTFTTPKSKTSTRDVDLSPALKRELRAFYMSSGSKDGLIFQTGNGTPQDPGNVYERWFKPAVKRAREKALEEDNIKILEGVTLHTLRHTFGSWKIAQGEDIVYVSRQMGHANVSITANVYAHLIDKRRPAAAAKTDAFLFGHQTV